MAGNDLMIRGNRETDALNNLYIMYVAKKVMLTGRRQLPTRPVVEEIPCQNRPAAQVGKCDHEH